MRSRVEQVKRLIILGQRHTQSQTADKPMFQIKGHTAQSATIIPVLRTDSSRLRMDDSLTASERTAVALGWTTVSLPSNGQQSP